MLMTQCMLCLIIALRVSTAFLFSHSSEIVINRVNDEDENAEFQTDDMTRMAKRISQSFDQSASTRA